MLTSIEIEHFKSIDHLQLELQPVNIFVGPNGAGKSNIIDAVRFLKEAFSHDLDRAVSDRHGIDSIRQWSPFKPYHTTIKVKMKTNTGSGSYLITFGSSKGAYRIIREEGSWCYNDKISFTDENDEFIDTKEILFQSRFTRSRDGSVVINMNGEDEELSLSDIQNDDLFLNSYRNRVGRFFENRSFSGLRRNLIDFEAYSIFPNTLRQTQKPSSDRRLSPSGDNLTSIFKSLSKTKRGSAARNEILSYMKKIMPTLDQILIQSLGGMMVPTFRVCETDNARHDFNVSQLSDGTLRVFGLLTALYQPDIPGIIALEEPEQTVNPAILALLAEAIRDASERSQILVTTHSPHLVDFFEPDEIFAVEASDKGLTTASRIGEAQKKAVKDKLFSLSELMTIEGLSGEKV